MKVYKIYINEETFNESGIELSEDYSLEDFFLYCQSLLHYIKDEEDRKRKEEIFLNYMKALVESVEEVEGEEDEEDLLEAERKTLELMNIYFDDLDTNIDNLKLKI